MLVVGGMAEFEILRFGREDCWRSGGGGGKDD